MLRSLQGYSAALLSRDLVAGLTLAAIAIPEQMATARLGGFAPQIGFFAFLAGALAFAVLGEHLTPLQLAGGALVLAAVVLLQLPARRGAPVLAEVPATAT